MEKQLELLKVRAPPSGAGTEPVGDRLVKLQRDAGALANTTDNLMKAIEGKVTQEKNTSLFLSVNHSFRD